MEQKIKFEHKCRVANNSIDCKTARIFAIVLQTVRYSNERSGASVTIKSETGERGYIFLLSRACEARAIRFQPFASCEQ